MLTLNKEVIENLKRFVYSIIKEYSNESNKEDLFQAGMLGVCEASKRYDSSSNVKFTTFAYKYILGEVLKYLREDRNIHISKDLIGDYKKIIKAKEFIYKSSGRPASNEEIAKILNLDEKRVQEAVQYNEKEYSLSFIIDNEENELSLQDVIYDKNKISDIHYIDLKDALNELDENEKKLIYERYFEDKTQTEIAKNINTSQVKVYRYERKVLDKLKDKMS